LPLLALLTLMSGCSAVVLEPSGDIAVQQRDLIIISTILMLLIIVPVIFLSLFFAWRYRESNKDARYEPDWHHSTKLELIIWSAPLLIIIALGSITWITTHTLDPYRPIDRIDASRPLPEDVKRLEVQVVALDWKWLFIYPEYGIATLNEMAAPVDRPIHFKITASTVMNSFFVPALAGQIYAMPGMQTQLHAVLNAPGQFEGFSANYSGAGFSDMKFKFLGLSDDEFLQWVEQVKRDGTSLQREDYLQIEKPSVREPVRHFATVDPTLFDAVVNLCVDRTKMCMSRMMEIDAQGGVAGLAGIANVANLAYDRPRALAAGERPRGNYVLSMCATDIAQNDFFPRLAAPTAR